MLALSKTKAAGYQPGNPDSHLKISRLCSKLADKLYQKEYRCLPLPKKFPYAAHLFSALSCSLYWRDVLYIRELLLQRGVDEHLELVRAHPADQRDGRADGAHGERRGRALLQQPHRH